MRNRYYARRFGIVAMLLLVAVAVTAQSALRTGYFLNGNPYRYRLNPALMNERNYIAMPIIGNIGINTAGNVGYDNFVFNALDTDDKVTFMHSSVDADDFLNGLDSENKIRANVDLVLLSGGFCAFGVYHTVDVGFRSRTNINVPYDLFRFMKVKGASDYSFTNLNFNTKNYLDLALGHSRKITDELTVGARVKFLFGLAYADLMVDRMDITMNGFNWTINARGSANIALGGEFGYSDEKTINGKTAVNGYRGVSPGLNGFGMGLDLGASYDLSDVLVEGLSVSAALNDIGYMKWKKVSKGEISPDNPYVFNGFTNIGFHDGFTGADIQEQFESLQEDLEDFFTLEDKGKGSEKCALDATLNLGAEYKMPFYDKLSAGILYTHGFGEFNEYNEVSMMLNWAPLRIFDFAVSGTTSTYGTNFGAMANIHMTGFNFFIGTDCFITNLNEDFIPKDNMNASVAFGVNIPFGKKR